MHRITKEGKCTCGGGPNCSPGKHPTRSFKRRHWEERFSVSGIWEDVQGPVNIAVLTGQPASRCPHIFVLDIDQDKGGMESLAHLLGIEPGTGAWQEAVLDRFPMETPLSETGGGGYHIFFEAPEEVEKVRSVTDLLPGVDVRGDGGLAIIPPSTHVSGSRYAWKRSPLVSDYDFQAPPAWLFYLLLERDVLEGPSLPESSGSRSRGGSDGDDGDDDVGR